MHDNFSVRLLLPSILAGLKSLMDLVNAMIGLNEDKSIIRAAYFRYSDDKHNRRLTDFLKLSLFIVCHGKRPVGLEISIEVAFISGF